MEVGNNKIITKLFNEYQVTVAPSISNGTKRILFIELGTLHTFYAIEFYTAVLPIGRAKARFHGELTGQISTSLSGKEYIVPAKRKKSSAG